MELEQSEQHPITETDLTFPDNDKSSNIESTTELVCCALKKHYTSSFCAHYHLPGIQDGCLWLPDMFIPVQLKDMKRSLCVATPDIFGPNTKLKEPSRILITGSAGCGKTTFCQKLAYDWANPHQCDRYFVHDFNLVLFFNIKHKKNIQEIINQELLSIGVRLDKEDVWNCITRSAEDMLIILDGYDELDESMAVLVNDILGNKLFGNSHILMTSDFGISKKLARLFHVQYKCDGFTQDQAVEFVKNFFHLHKLSSERFSNLLNFISDEESIADLYQNPFNLLNMCVLTDRNPAVEFRTKAKLYLDMVRLLGNGCLSDEGSGDNSGIDCFQVLCNWGILVLENLLGMNSSCAELGSGDTQVLERNGYSLKSSVQHLLCNKPWQYFSAALALSRMDEDEQKLKLKSVLVSNSGLAMLVVLFCGISHIEQAPFLKSNFITVMNSQMEDMYGGSHDALLYHCIHECDGDPVLCKLVADRLPEPFCAAPPLSEVAITGLSSILKCKTKLKKARIVVTSLTRCGAKYLSEALGYLTQLKSLTLQGAPCKEVANLLHWTLQKNKNIQNLHCYFGFDLEVVADDTVKILHELGPCLEGITHLIWGCEHPKYTIALLKDLTTSISHFSLVSSMVDNDTAFALCRWLENTTSLESFTVNVRLHEISNLIPNVKGYKQMMSVLQTLSGLKTLRLHHVPVQNDCAQHVHTILQNNPHLETLCLDIAGFKGDGIAPIMAGVASHPTLKALSLNANDIKDAGVALVASAMTTNNTLQDLHLNHCSITGAACLVLCNTLKNNQSLKKLELGDNFLGDVGAEALSQLVNDNKILQVLDASWNGITAKGVVSLTDAVQKSRALQRLNLSGNRITGEAVQSLAQMLRNSNTLQNLDLSWNKINDEDLKILAEALQGNKTLERLDLNMNCISSEGVAIVASCFHSNTTLQELDLDHNPVEIQQLREIFQKSFPENGFKISVDKLILRDK